MGDYLSHIATRSSGVAPENTVTPQGLLSYAMNSVSDDIAVEVSKTIGETRTQAFTATQNTFDRPIVPKVYAKQAQVFNNPPPQYLNKHIERLSIESIEKPVFYGRVDTQKYQRTEGNDPLADHGIAHQEQNLQIEHPSYSVPKFVSPAQKPVLAHPDTLMPVIDEKINPKERQKPILAAHTEGGQNLDILVKDPTPKHLKPTLQPENTINDRIKLQPSILALETPMVKKAAASPKLVIGRITVEVLPPPVAPLVKTIVRTVERGGSASTHSDNTIHKLSFGLGQL